MLAILLPAVLCSIRANVLICTNRNRWSRTHVLSILYTVAVKNIFAKFKLSSRYRNR